MWISTDDKRMPVPQSKNLVVKFGESEDDMAIGWFDGRCWRPVDCLTPYEYKPTHWCLVSKFNGLEKKIEHMQFEEDRLRERCQKHEGILYGFFTGAISEKDLKDYVEAEMDKRGLL